MSRARQTITRWKKSVECCAPTWTTPLRLSSGEEKFWSIRREGKTGERACRRRTAGSGLLQARGAPMERTFADIEADIASLRASVAKYRALAEERLAHGQLMIAQKQMEFVADLEAR